MSEMAVELDDALPHDNFVPITLTLLTREKIEETWPHLMLVNLMFIYLFSH